MKRECFPGIIVHVLFKTQWSKWDENQHIILQGNQMETQPLWRMPGLSALVHGSQLLCWAGLKSRATKAHNGFLLSQEENKQMSIIFSNVNCVLTKYLNIAYYQFPRVRTQNQLTIDQVHQIFAEKECVLQLKSICWIKQKKGESRSVSWTMWVEWSWAREGQTLSEPLSSLNSFFPF